MRLRKSVQLVLCMGLGLILSGCAGYRPTQPLSESGQTNLQLLPIVNEASLAGIIGPLNRHLRAGLAGSHNWRVVDDSPASAQLRVVITGNSTRALARDPADTGRPISFLDNLTARLEWNGRTPAPWSKTANGRAIEVTAEALIYPNPSLVDARAQTIEQLARDLAAAIIAELEYPRAG